MWAGLMSWERWTAVASWQLNCARRPRLVDASDWHWQMAVSVADAPLRTELRLGMIAVQYV